MTVIAWVGLIASALIALGIIAGLLTLKRRMLGADGAPPEQLTARDSSAEEPRRLEAEG